ncbi:hypothetical protein NM688_g1906 [Phlebia brevispora]|uniref:Uncharacterized protein n=1 Tax=Phlebia brevispora TaxID=194682 RepID=A0ACC1TA08_9APHY|nr:hypothetical protein NM688_g1906 [Phlebia brevispora]
MLPSTWIFIMKDTSISYKVTQDSRAIYKDIILLHSIWQVLCHPSPSHIDRSVMEPPVYKLEMPDGWRLSRSSVGWWKSSLEGIEFGEDPMDEEDFDEASAFPSCKPCVDIFGPLLSTRWIRQRGWYQRKRRPAAEGSELVLSREQVTGVDVPQELFDSMIKHLGWKRGYENRSMVNVKASKQELGRLALVCRRWAKSLQPKIFEEITLRNREDAVALLSFLKCPTSAVSRYVRELKLVIAITSYPYPPWIHTVCSFIFPRLHCKPKIILTLDGPLPSEKAMKSLHEFIPGSMPLFCSGIQRVNLTDLHFKSYTHLSHTIASLPNLIHISLKKVTWDCTPESENEVPPARRARFRQPPKYSMEECTANAAAIWFRVLLNCPGQSIEQVDATQLCRIALAVAKGAKSGQCDGREVIPETLCLVGALPNDHSFRMHIFLTPHVEGQARNIQSVVFNSRFLLELVDIDWKGVSNMLAILPRLQALLFVFDEPDDMLSFRKSVVLEKMARFKGDPRLKYALNIAEYPGYYKWVQVSCADDGTIDEIGPQYNDESGWKHLL